MCRCSLRATFVALLIGVVGTAAVVSAVPAQAEGGGDTRVTKAVANKGQPVVVGPDVATIYPIRVWISDSSGVKSLWIDTFNTRNGHGYAEVVSGHCVKISKTKSRCLRNLRLAPIDLAGYNDESANAMAGIWTLYVRVVANDDDYQIADDVIHFPVLRQTLATILPTAAATVAKGHTVRFAGRLMHADWEHQRWAPFRSHEVQLRFKRKGTSSYRTVKTVTTSSSGHMAANVIASHPGSYRWRSVRNSRNAKSVSAATLVTLTH